MRKFTVRGPGKSCIEIDAANLDQAIQEAEKRYPGKQVTADAAEVIYVCNPNEDETACQMKLL